MSTAINISSSPPTGWNELVEHQSYPHFEQFSWYAEAEATDNWSVLYATIQKDGQIAAGALILTRIMRKAGRIGYVFRGPLCRKPTVAGKSYDDLSCTLLKKASRAAGLRFLVIVPPYDANEFSRHALNTGFARHPDFLPPSRLPTAGTLIDLRKTSDLVEKSFRSKTRQQISLGRRAGVVVEHGGATDLDEFWELHEALCQRRGVRSNIPSLAYVRALWSAFAPKERAWMFQVRLGGDLVCSLICLRAGSTCYAWRIGWNGAHADKHPTKVLYAEAIRHASAAGCERFDLMGIDPAVAAALQRGEKPVGVDAGITLFKLGFGGTVTVLPPTLIWFPNPVLRLFFKGIGFPVLRNRRIRRFLLKQK